MLVKKVTIHLVKPDSQTVMVPALTGIHSVFGAGIVIGTIMLFMVFASNTGLGSAIGKAPPEMSTATSVIMTLIGSMLLFGSNWLRNNFKSYYVLDKRKSLVLLRHQFLENIFRDVQIVDLKLIISVSVKTRPAAATAREIFDLLFGLVKFDLMGREKQSAKTTEDTALVATLINGDMIYLSHFENGQDNADAAFEAARDIDSWLDIPDAIRNTHIRKDFIDSAPPVLAFEILKWTVLVGFLIWITWLLISSTMD